MKLSPVVKPKRAATCNAVFILPDDRSIMKTTVDV